MRKKVLIVFIIAVLVFWGFTNSVNATISLEDNILGSWTYCSVEKVGDTQKDFKEIVNYTNVEELGTFNFYSDNTFTIFSGGKFTTDFDNPSEYEKKYKIANNKINIETANFSITFEYDEETGMLIQDYQVEIDNKLQEYKLYLKKTKNVISNQDMLNKLLGNWTYCSVEKKHNTQKDFKEIVNYTNIEELGTFSFYKDNTFTIRSGGKFTMDFENPSESVKKYTIQNNKINIETANFLITFEYDEKTGMLIQDYQVVVDNKLQGYRLYLKKEADNSSINSEKEDSTTSKFELPKAGISNFIAIMILSTIVIFIIIGIKMKKMKDVK